MPATVQPCPDPTDAGLRHVLHVRIVSGTGGGPEKTILSSPRHLLGTRYRAHVCYLYPLGDPGFETIRLRAAERDCPLIALPDGRFDLGVLSALRQVCRDLGITIWHGHDYKTNFFGVLLRPRLNFKLVSTAHGWVKHTSRTPLYHAIDRWALRRHDHVVAVSDDVYQACRAAGVPEHRLSLIENAIDTHEFCRQQPAGVTRAPVAASDGRSTGRLVVGAVGRLSEEKGFHLLIDAAVRLLDEGFDMELWIAGEGEDREPLQRRIDRSGHAARLRLLGFQADTRSLFERFDLFCLSSLREGLPNVVLEAMAMEVPVVATRCGGMPAFGRDGEDMLLVEPGSPGALAEGLRRLLSDDGQRHRLACAARRRIEREHSFSRRMERMVQVYDRLWDR